MTEHVRGPAARPCSSCPYLTSTPSGVWDSSEYSKLAAYDRDTGMQPHGLFLCHQTDRDDPRARLCAGWVGCHGGPELLAVRLAASRGVLNGADLDATLEYRSPAELFESGAAAAAHGIRDITNPGVRAQEAIAKIEQRRPSTHIRG